MQNDITTIRPHSTFANFKPQTPSQTEAFGIAQLFAGEILSVTAAFNKTGQGSPNGPMMLVMTGSPGTGKTHLMEAIFNHVQESDPGFAAQCFLLRENFTKSTVIGVNDHTFSNKPVILIDDLFSEHQSTDRLCRATDLPQFMQFLSLVYDRNKIAILTSNFPFTAGILPRIQELDQVGRVYSRCQQMIEGNSAEIHIEAPDYRRELAKQGGLKARLAAGISTPR